MYDYTISLTQPQAALLKNILLEYLVENPAFSKISFDIKNPRNNSIKDLYCLYRAFLPLMQDVTNNISSSGWHTSPYDLADPEDLLYTYFHSLIDWMPSADAIERLKHNDS
jgi:hypothetical protein